MLQIYIKFLKSQTFLEYFCCFADKMTKSIILSGRSNVTFAPKVCHFTIVPMILYPPKVSSEHLVDDVGTSVNHHRNDPKVTILTKSTAFSSKCLYFERKFRIIVRPDGLKVRSPRTPSPNTSDATRYAVKQTQKPSVNNDYELRKVMA